ncbi:MAG: hypothetical protein BMS9Abin15_0267 [Gammaproteobacteria bacterium]|nr:MAG: hypothetical protein BMS9Abin15_0267 [Gammaproteobacteria bacterium]
MQDDRRLNVVLCWHMHQPQYRDHASSEWRQPWTYLHTIKDYTDMAAHLEHARGAKAVVNFAPVLLEQISAYGQQLTAHQEKGEGLSDPLLSALAAEKLPQDAKQRYMIIRACLRANEDRVINRYPEYLKLAEMARQYVEDENMLVYLSDAFLSDLLVWYHLAWLGESVRRSNVRIKALIKQGCHYTHEQRHELLAIVAELINGIIERYRRLAELGVVELSVSPYAHPIVPLLLDFKSAREAVPNIDLPGNDCYPGGEERARWHIDKAFSVFEQYFGFKPTGCWPSEGSMSEHTVRLLGEAGFQWAAGGESTLHNSLDGQEKDGAGKAWLYQPYQLEQRGLKLFFRDDRLSDLIGFEYATWHADDAVANLIHELTEISRQLDKPGDHVVSIILDGENAWEHYPNNGWYFLKALYKKLGAHSELRLTTFTQASQKISAQKLKRLVAGSWVYGTFTTWIGDKDKNRGWDLLVDAKHAFDDVIAHGLSGRKLIEAEGQLAICEGSDWFWWLGDYNPAQAVRDFERLFRDQLRQFYLIIGVSPPAVLDVPLSEGKGEPEAGGVMRKGQRMAH